jgi:hypothetical protein
VAEFWDNAINVWLIEICKQKSSSVLQLSNFMFGVRAIFFSTLIDKPYLTGEQDLDLMIQTNILDSNFIIINNNKTLFIVDESERKSKLKTPFLISSISILLEIIPTLILIGDIFALHLLGPIPMVLMFVLKKYEKVLL